MAQFCDECGSEIGFFSRKRVQGPDGQVFTVCRKCAEVVSSRTLRSRSEVEAAVGAAADAAFEVVAPPKPAPAGSPVLLEPDAQDLLEFVTHEFVQRTGIDIRRDPLAMERVAKAVKAASEELKSNETADINLPFLAADSSGPKHMQLTVRAKSES